MYHSTRVVRFMYTCTKYCMWELFRIQNQNLFLLSDHTFGVLSHNSYEGKGNLGMFQYDNGSVGMTRAKYVQRTTPDRRLSSQQEENTATVTVIHCYYAVWKFNEVNQTPNEK